jgi:hypothetical protein
MFYLGKFLQAAGLGFLLIGYIQHFPRLVDYKTLGISILIFTTGWLISQYLVKR